MQHTVRQPFSERGNVCWALRAAERPGRAADKEGRKRLDNAKDLVRRKIATGLSPEGVTRTAHRPYPPGKQIPRLTVPLRLSYSGSLAVLLSK